jgi:hypothetical protein
MMISVEESFAAWLKDPIGSGLAASLTRPGRNITGFTLSNPKWRQVGPVSQRNSAAH